MYDDNELEAGSDDLMPRFLLPTPTIGLPLDRQVVDRGSLIHVDTHVSGHTNWNLDFSRSGQAHRFARISGGAGSRYVRIALPLDLPVDTLLYLKFEYKSIIYSPWSSSRFFTIRPIAQPTISNPQIVRISRPALSGTGTPGATLRLYRHTDGNTVFATTQVRSDGRWSVALTRDLWSADPFMMNSQQELNGGLSPWGVPVSFTVLLPLTISSVSVSPDLKPTVTGTGGLNGATLEIWRTGGAGGVLMSKVLNATGNWSVTASAAWTPGRYSVTSRLKSGGHYSEWSGDKAFTIQPPRPVISPPPNPAAVKQPLTVTNVASGAVTLKMLTEANVPVAGSFSGSGATRTFTPAADWSWGTNKVKVVQTVDDVTSEASELATVTVKLPKPVITPPPNPAAVKQPLMITNVASGAVILQMLTEANVAVAGNFSGSGDRRTFTPTADWSWGTSRVKVVQTVGGVASEASELVTVTLKPAPPVINNIFSETTSDPVLAEMPGSTVQRFKSSPTAHREAETAKAHRG